jgi:altronate hydrolase
VRKYNQIIGTASADIPAGAHMHVHNLVMTEVEHDFAIGSAAYPVEMAVEPATFMGIRRADGRVATRNHIGILTSVNCSARVARAIADHFRRDLRPEVLAHFPNVDGVVALTHGVGCGVDTRSAGMAMVRRALAGYAVHPNFGAVLMIGLGCEANQISDILAERGLSTGDALRTFTIQEQGGTAKTIQHGIEQIKAILPMINNVKREPSRRRTSLSVSNAAAPTAIPASLPILRWGPRSTCL